MDELRLLPDARLLEGRDPRVVNEWTILRPGKRALKARFVLRGYDRARLARALRKAGLVPVAWYGDMGVTRGKGRLVALARKPFRRA